MGTVSAIGLVEQGVVPDRITRAGIRRLLRQRLRELRPTDCEHTAASLEAFLEMMNDSPVALVPDKANEQHYEVPAEFFAQVLGPRAKYSCCYWGPEQRDLAEAEDRALEITCERARLENGQHILELGCGWGSLTLYMALPPRPDHRGIQLHVAA